MGQRASGPNEARHVERERLGAAGPHHPLELECERPLGRAHDDLGQQRRERAIRHGAGGGDPLELRRLLHGAVRLDPALDRDELDVRGRRLEPPPQRVRDESGLDRDPPRADRLEQSGHAAGRS